MAIEIRLVATALLFVAGCGGGLLGGSTIDKLGLKATDFFDDARVVALCEACERGDLEKVTTLLADGVDVNSVGESGVTPLLWAYPDDKPEIFEALLKAGADPNVKLTDDLGDGRWIKKGDSVTYLAAKSRFEKHFGLVMDHGGDPNITDYKDETPLFAVIMWAPDKKKRVNRLLDAGADPNWQSKRTNGLPVTTAIVWGGQYDLAKLLLENGADPLRQRPDGMQSAPELVLSERGPNKYRSWTADLERSYSELMDAMAERGVDWEEERRSWEARLRKDGVIK